MARRAPNGHWNAERTTKNASGNKEGAEQLGECQVAKMSLSTEQGAAAPRGWPKGRLTARMCRADRTALSGPEAT